MEFENGISDEETRKERLRLEVGTKRATENAGFVAGVGAEEPRERLGHLLVLEASPTSELGRGLASVGAWRRNRRVDSR